MHVGTPQLTDGPQITDSQGLADIRVRFLGAEPVEAGQVRDVVLASWWRSRRWDVAADRVELPYVRDPDLETPLPRSALRVLRHLRDNLDGQPISIILTDANGLVLTRLTADADLERHLDRVKLAPGFSYAEKFVGTNGIGSALEGGRPMHVFGHEHYAEDLEDLACAGVPIHHPISGKTVGALDLTCWRRDAGPLLVALARTTADQIRQALLADTGMREFELLQEYLRACRRSTGIVLALNNDLVMMNDSARQVLDPSDQSVLLGHAGEALAEGRRGPVTVVLPTGATARLHCRPVRTGGRLAGGVVHVALVEQELRPGAEVRRTPRMLLPGLVGSGPLWVRSCHEVEEVHRSGEWLALAGEPGVGKLALVRAVHQRHNPSGRLRVVDGEDASTADLRAELLCDADTLVIRHVDRLDAARLRSLSAVLQEAVSASQRGAVWVVVTFSGNATSNKHLAKLLRLFPSTVTLPPLRHHIDDLSELVPFFLAKLGHGGPLTCSPEAMRLLVRASWPGNAAELNNVLGQAVRRRRTGVIHPNDLPLECRAVSRRALSPLESMERDAIVSSLLDTGGDKPQAARALGISRATIYRKIRDYGIVGVAERDTPTGPLPITPPKGRRGRRSAD